MIDPHLTVIVIYVPVLCALCSVMRYYGPTVLIVGRKKPGFEGLKFFFFALGPASLRYAGPWAKLKNFRPSKTGF